MGESGLSIPEVGRRFSVPPSSIDNWVKADGKLGNVGKKHRILSEEVVELARLKRELAEGKMPHMSFLFYSFLGPLFSAYLMLPYLA
ncbi:MAG: hypothetical protein H7843_12325 [Nitrospirota bacterium]